ncbi:MAG: hypothetical protein KIH89_000365 [Candidatus Shapirobacteria bacterium]|nr:hypothetical protein [Candidatus Shapirobacteria bacterium]
MKKTKKIKSLEKKIAETITTKKNLPLVQIPLIGVIVFCLLLAATSFTAGYSFLQLKGGVSNKTAVKASATLEPKKSDKPELQFYVMSFCPYGNQIEEAIKPVFDLLGNSVSLKPQYIFEKISDLKKQCQQYDASNCANYIKAGYFPSDSECKSQLANYSKDCYDEKNYLKIGNTYYSSLHGRVEANQNVREICAYNMNDDKTNWWKFIENINTACTAEDADTCWEEQAKKAGLDTNKITECFNTQAADLIEKEIALTTQYQVQGSPTLMLDGAEFPPKDASTADGKGGLKIGKKVFAESQYRSADFLKESLCASFNKAPKTCKQVLKSATTDEAANAGGDATANAAPQGSCN